MLHCGAFINLKLPTSDHHRDDIRQRRDETLYGPIPRDLHRLRTATRGAPHFSLQASRPQASWTLFLPPAHPPRLHTPELSTKPQKPIHHTDRQHAFRTRRYALSRRCAGFAAKRGIMRDKADTLRQPEQTPSTTRSPRRRRKNSTRMTSPTRPSSLPVRHAYITPSQSDISSRIFEYRVAALRPARCFPQLAASMNRHSSHEQTTTSSQTQATNANTLHQTRKPARHSPAKSARARALSTPVPRVSRSPARNKLPYTMRADRGTKFDGYETTEIPNMEGAFTFV